MENVRVEVVEEEMETGGELEEVYECEACQESFTNISEHMQKYHQSEQETTLEENVEFEITDEEDPLDQMADEEVPMAFVIKNNDGRFECSQCFQTYKSLKRFLAHVKTHGEIDDENIKKLEEYLLKLENADSLFELIEDEDSDKMKFRCKICNTEFETKKRFLLHYPIHRNVAEARRANRLVVKANEQSFHCQLCNRSLKNSSELEMHMNAHAENATIGSRLENAAKSPKKKKKIDGQSSMYPCQYCQKEFKRPHEKVKHERIHTGEKPYSCEICGKQFRVTYCLSLHKKNVHCDERPYVCSFENCNKRFKSQSVYNHHLNTHGTAKNYKCPFCVKAFKTSVQLAGHKNTHTKPFSCNICSRAFASLYAVKIHMEVHRNLDTNLKFVCKICNAQYGRSFALNEHIKSAHDGMPNEAVEDTEEHYVIESDTQSVVEEEDNKEVYSVVMVAKK